MDLIIFTLPFHFKKAKDIADQVLTGEFWGAAFPDSKRYPTASQKVDPKYRWFVTSKKFRKGQDEHWPIPQSEVNVNPKLGL
jgi:hypothetical protein